MLVRRNTGELSSKKEFDQISVPCYLPEQSDKYNYLDSAGTVYVIDESGHSHEVVKSKKKEEHGTA